jgi:tetratricopeptide (TPR) repeat protein
MNGIPRTAPSSTQPMSRDLLLSLIETALRTDELRYARRLCTAWLAIYPGDLQVNLLFARAYYKEKSSELQLLALPILEELCKLDPEFLEAQELLVEVRQLAGSSNHLVAKACANALSHGRDLKTGKDGHVSSWAKYVYEARISLDSVRSGDYQQIEKAEYYIHKALIENPDTPLAAVIHLRLMESKGSMPKSAVRSLAQIYHERWPDCLQFMLTLSNELMESGESNDAVIMLHQAVSKDIAGQVPRRMWGNHHQYSSIWPANLEAINTGQNSPQNIPIPAAVASFLGWNQIGAGFSGFTGNQSPDNLVNQSRSETTKIYPSTSSYKYIPHSFSNDTDTSNLSEQAQTFQTELERMADELKRPHVVREDGRFPIYVIFTTRTGLESQYGSSASQNIDAELKKFASVVHGHKVNQEFWGSLLFYADDPAYTQPFELKPAQYNDSYQLKIILNDLDAALEKRGERIGALLIVGGPEIVPFHNLPNPVEDADVDVPSDNPYAAKDSNYFISDWPVGRISGGTESDPRYLLTILKSIANRYDPKALKFSWYHQLIEYVQELIRRGISKKQSSFGYTAAVWRRASQSVYRSIGEPNDLLVSPPTHTCINPDAPSLEESPGKDKSNSCLLLPQARLGYFNLHGVPDGSEWYGQVDPTQPEDGPDFPVAMRPEDIHNSGSAPRLIFTEACYGANITGKTVDEAISLKFIASGTHAVIGSTCISYGSLATPLSSADLIGRVFWSLLQEGFTAGESLRRAKIHLTREMHRRQGFLDAEDQKTLISFVLFGDPLAQPFHTKVSPKITPHLSDSAVPVPTVCEQSCENESDSPVSLETISHLKSVVEQYLPGMGDANVSLSRERQSCSYFCNHYWTGKKCVRSQSGGKNNPAIKFQRRVVTLSKNIEQAQHIHRQYARLTLDESGKIVKMVVSR